HFQNKISISAKTGEGIPQLIDFLREQLINFDSQYSSYSLSESERSLITDVFNTLDKILSFQDITLLAEEIRKASDTIGSLLGLNIGEDSLNHIFQKMCIGK